MNKIFGNASQKLLISWNFLTCIPKKIENRIRRWIHLVTIS